MPRAPSGVLLLSTMWRYLKSHERFVIDALARPGENISMLELKDFHERQLRYMQHERLIHLLVTLFVSTYLLLTIGFIAVHPIWPAFALAALLFALVSAYVVHYFRLENGVQRWYHLANRIDERLGRVSQRRADVGTPSAGNFKKSIGLPWPGALARRGRASRATNP